MKHIFHQQAFHQQCTIKIHSNDHTSRGLSLRLGVYVYTVSWDVGDICEFDPKNSESHNQLICFLPIPEQINAAPGPLNGWGGYWLLITESRHASQANPGNDTSDSSMTCLRSTFKPRPTLLLPLPPTPLSQSHSADVTRLQGKFSD